MNYSHRHVLFTLDGYRYALPLSAVKRITRVVEVTPLPKAPEIILGVINMQGRVIPVVNVRKRFRLPEREIELSDQLVIAHTGKRTVALVADAVGGVVECSEREMISPKEILPQMEYVDGVMKLEDGLTLVHDLDNFLSLEEEERLDDVMRKNES